MKIIYRKRNGEAFAEFELEDIEKNELYPHDIRVGFTKCALESAKVLGYECCDKDELHTILQ